MKIVNIRAARVVLAATLVIAAESASAQYKQVNLVSDLQGMARYTDPNLIDPWGMVLMPDGSSLVANARTGLTTSYARDGRPFSFTVNVPPAPSEPFGPVGTPTGLIANRTSQFVISKNGKSGPALLLFDTLDGTISGWNPDVDPNHAVIAIDNSAEVPFPASYTALAFARNASGENVLYAADSGGGASLSNNRIDMFDGDFNYLGSFSDPTAPSNMTVFGIQYVGRKLYVTYAAFTPINGGVVDVFDTDGNLLERFAANDSSGPLEEPWAVTRAPGNFGRFSNALLVGNFGDGRINAYNSRTGKFLGQLTDGHGHAVSDGLGLWALGFRPDHQQKNGPAKLIFTSGINGESDGLLGYIVPKTSAKVARHDNTNTH
jgi:uncharacterized protein (TIGR03118 family)